MFLFTLSPAIGDGGVGRLTLTQEKLWNAHHKAPSWLFAGSILSRHIRIFWIERADRVDGSRLEALVHFFVEDTETSQGCGSDAFSCSASAVPRPHIIVVLSSRWTAEIGALLN